MQASYGFAAFGSTQAHDLAQVNLSYGHMLGRVLGKGHWYCGNPEFCVERGPRATTGVDAPPYSSSES